MEISYNPTILILVNIMCSPIWYKLKKNIGYFMLSQKTVSWINLQHPDVQHYSART